jgi:hypothetical protein
MTGAITIGRVQDSILGGLVAAALATPVSWIWSDGAVHVFGMSPVTGGIVGVAFASWVRRGEPVERIAARMGVAAVIVMAILTPPFGALLAFAVGVFGAFGLAVAVPIAVAYVLIVRTVFAAEDAAMRFVATVAGARRVRS